jgi:cysteinyl-tRNA synthetase
LQAQDIRSLRQKAGGGGRLVICYLSIGEAESYRYYWDRSWDGNRDGRPDAGAPEWLAGENPDWQGNYKVRYWDAGWQAILFGSGESYLDQILSRGFDGVYLDIIDAFEYFEKNGP